MWTFNMNLSNKLQLVEDIFEHLSNYGGFDNWWDDIEESDKKIIRGDIFALINDYGNE